MNSTPYSAKPRHVAVLRALDAGVDNVPEITKSTGYDVRAVRDSLVLMQRRGLVKNCAKRRGTGSPGRYELVVNLQSAIEEIDPPRAGQWRADALSIAWPMPSALPSGTIRTVVVE